MSDSPVPAAGIPGDQSGWGGGTRRVAGSGWTPAAAVALLTAAVLVYYGVSVRDLTFFGAYVVLALALPGTLLVRALYGGARTLAEEFALGLALGYAVEVGVYVAARAAGAPLAVLAWPAVTYAVFLAVPGLRRHWRSGARVKAPAWWSWSIALAVAFLVAWSVLMVYRITPLAWPDLKAAFYDLPFHLALVGELKYHLPPTTPWIAGEPLFYHWFVYAHLAAANWITGVEPVVLLLRLAMLPMLAAIVVVFGLIGRRVTGSHTGGLLVVAGILFVTVPSLYLGKNGAFTWGGVPDLSWQSPTQTFGTLLFAPLTLLVVDMLGGRRGAGRWVMTGVLTVAVMGAKAVYLPLLAVGLAAVAVVETVRRRRPHRTSLVMLVMTAVCLLFAQFVLFGGVRQGVSLAPLFHMRTAWTELTGLAGEPPAASLLGITLVFLLAQVIAWSGIPGLLSRPGLLARPETVLMLGIGTAGIGAGLLLGHPTRSQLFFLWAAYPYLTVLSVHGLLTLHRRAGLPRRWTALAAGGGVAAVYLVPFACGVVVPLGPGRPDSLLYLPYVALPAVAVVAAAVLVRTAGRLRAWALITVALAAVALPADLHARVLAIGHDTPGTLVAPGERSLPPGAPAAARWLRDHSDPDDLVASNAHCRWGYHDLCDKAQFWVAALSERRVLVEGWAYTATNLDRARPGEVHQLPFWDADRLRANDAVFSSPSAAAVRELRDRYGVRWLFADERQPGLGAGLGKVADLRFRSGGCAVYRLPDA
ncbi:hypothetical protein AB0D67_03700 [Streptosporangium sp. NPDC048047]|uniref:hypothetical protein n=1 Tax=Streptosporangium sp. NPDC048047 TaxID=3155748 RepID=UPI00341FFC36